MSNLSNIFASIGKDKWAHFAISLALVLVIYAVCSIWLGPVAAGIAFVVSMGVGVIKEIADKKGNGAFDPYDIVANFLGCFLGVIIIALLLI